MPQRECRDEVNDVSKTGEEEDHAEQEEQVVVAGDHVLGTQPDVVEDPPGRHRRAGGLGDPVGMSAGGKADKPEQDERQPSAKRGGGEC